MNTQAFVLTRSVGSDETTWSGPYDLSHARDIVERMRAKGVDARYTTLRNAFFAGEETSTPIAAS